MQDGRRRILAGHFADWHRPIPTSRSQSIEHAHEAGFVLGHFPARHQRSACGEAPRHARGIPHHPPATWPTSTRRCGRTPARNASGVPSKPSRCHRFIEERREWCSILEDAKDAGKLSLRPVHGDPKISNIMIDDATGKGTCIIDLDTVKPGLIHYDFGDCLRSCCNPAGEEVLDLNRVLFDTDMCEAIVRGYMAPGTGFS